MYGRRRSRPRPQFVTEALQRFPRERGATRAVCSSGVPSGRSMTTWNSLLLSNGSILTVTRPERDQRDGEQQARRRRGTTSRTRPVDQPGHHAAVDAVNRSSLLVRVRRRRRCISHAAVHGRDDEGDHAARRSSPPSRRPGSAACTGPSGRRTNAIGRMRRDHGEASRGSSGCRPRPPRGRRSRSSASPGPPSREVPDDVLDDDDRVVDEDADREDQREERDAVERVAVEVEDEAASAPASPGRRPSTTTASRRPSVSQIRIDTENDGDEHVPEQLVRLVLGRLAVVARDGDVHVGGDDRPAQPLDAPRPRGA